MGAKARQLYNGIIARAFRTRTAVLALKMLPTLPHGRMPLMPQLL